MWLLRLTTLLMVVTYNPLLPVTRHSGMRITKDEQTNQTQVSLELATSVVRQRYCKSSDPAGNDTLRLDLQLRYKNIGQQDVILYKGSKIAYREMVSASVQDAVRMHYILDLSLMADVSGAPEITPGPVPDKNFVILPRGTTFETMASTGGILFLKRRDEEKTADTFGTGEYLLQVQVSTFPYPQSLENELRQRWKPSGELWASGITSRPMTFRVEKDRKAVDCDP